MFERIDREADGEVYVNEVLDFLRSISSDLDQVGKDITTVRSFLNKTRLGSIRSSPGYGLSTPYRLTIRNSASPFF